MKVENTTYGLLPKKKRTYKINSRVKQANEKIEEGRNQKNKTIDGYAKLIQSIIKEYHKLALEHDLLKKKFKKTRR